SNRPKGKEQTRRGTDAPRNRRAAEQTRRGTDAPRNRRAAEQTRRGTDAPRNRRAAEQTRRGTDAPRNRRAAAQTRRGTDERRNRRAAEPRRRATDAPRNRRAAEQTRGGTDAPRNRRAAEQKRRALLFVMRGLDARIHGPAAAPRKAVGPRVKPGDDEDERIRRGRVCRLPFCRWRAREPSPTAPPRERAQGEQMRRAFGARSHRGSS